MILLLAGAALAADAPDLTGFVGTWGLDPSKSDDPTEAFQRAADKPSDLQATSARQLSPDGGESADEDTGKRALDDAYALLGASGGLSVTTTSTGIEVGWTGVPPVELPLTRRFQKVKDEDHPWKARAWMDGDHLVVERKLRTTSVAETLLPKERDDELVVVVWVEGSSLGEPIEFRRVYRALAPEGAP